MAASNRESPNNRRLWAGTTSPPSGPAGRAAPPWLVTACRSGEPRRVAGTLAFSRPPEGTCRRPEAADGRLGAGRFSGYRGLRPVLAIRQVLSAATRPTLRAITPSALHLRKSKGQGRTWPGASATDSTAEVAQKGLAPVGSLPVPRAGPLAADGASVTVPATTLTSSSCRVGGTAWGGARTSSLRGASSATVTGQEIKAAISHMFRKLTHVRVAGVIARPPP